jgi:hypothetical protein
MGAGEGICPHCLARGSASPAQGAVGVLRCRDCGNTFAPQADGTVALLLPDHVLVQVACDRFAIVLRGFFVTFGRACCDLVFELLRDRFVWSAPPSLGPLRLEEARRTMPRDALRRFAWRRFGRRTESEGHEVVSDLLLVASDGSELRAGFAFPAKFAAGPSIATALQWAHESWFESGPAYRVPGTETERPPLSILRCNGRVEALERT